MKFTSPKRLFFVFFLSVNWINAQQVLYDEFVYSMPFAAAKSLFKLKKKKYNKLALGNKTVYTLRKTSLVSDKDDKLLISISLWSKKNLNLKQAETYLKTTRKYLEALGYQTVYYQENWSKPLLINKKKPGVRFIDKDKTILIELESRGHVAQGGTYNIFVTYYNYQWFMNQILDTK